MSVSSRSPVSLPPFSRVPSSLGTLMKYPFEYILEILEQYCLELVRWWRENTLSFHYPPSSGTFHILLCVLYGLILRFYRQQGPSDVSAQASNQKHQHFIGILRETLRILKPLSKEPVSNWANLVPISGSSVNFLETMFQFAAKQLY
jgi:hypothetical protein